MERYTGIEPVSQPWEGRILPLNQYRVMCRRCRRSERADFTVVNFTEFWKIGNNYLGRIRWLKIPRLWLEGGSSPADDVDDAVDESERQLFSRRRSSRRCSR